VSRRAGLERDRGGNWLVLLHQAVGNQAVRQLLEPSTGLKSGSPGDLREQEADRAAERLDPAGPVLGPTIREVRTGDDRGGVRIHTDERSAEMAEALNADAFTVGSDIYFGAGKFQPRTRESDRLLAHELTHVAQQSVNGPALQAKLKITGKAADLTRAEALLNSQLFGHQVSIDKAGNVSIATTKEIGPPTPQQQAAASRLTTVINDAKTVSMTVSAGSSTIGGSFTTGDFDIADLEKYGAPGLYHEVEEQYQKQVKGLAFGTEATGAHAAAITAESEVRGSRRGTQKNVSAKMNPDGTSDAVVEVPHTLPDGTVKTMVITIKNDNITSVTWK
jgi:hypothetical protein